MPQFERPWSSSFQDQASSICPITGTTLIMFLLAFDKYKSAISKLKNVAINNLFARSVVERHVDGKVYVDNILSPNAFYVVHPYGMSLLYGIVTDDYLQSHLKSYFLGINGFRKNDEFLQVFPTEIENRIDEILGNNLYVHDLENQQYRSECTVVKHKRVNFKFNRLKFRKFLSKIDLNKFQFSPVNTSLFNETQGSVVPNQFWDHATDFSRSGVGFSLAYKNHPVAIAFSSFVHDQMLELGMETKPEYRRRGFASIVSAKLITYCLERGLEPVWSCRFGNHGSYSLALKLGFEPIAYLPYYELLSPNEDDREKIPQ